MQQSTSERMAPLFSAESFRVACSSVLKEMAVSCDLEDLEKVFWKFVSLHVKIIFGSQQERVRQKLWSPMLILSQIFYMRT